MAYTNLPVISPSFEDGNLVIVDQTNEPAIVILGTAASGDANVVYRVKASGDAVSEYGRTEGTLMRGYYEVYGGGARNIKLLRIGSTAAKLTGVGTGFTIETLERDETAGYNYTLYFDDSTGRLRIWRVSDDLLVYDNNPAYPSGAIDEFLISVSGTWTTGAGDIGTLANPITLAAASGVSGAVYTAGTDGIQLSRMQLFEALYKGYKLLENENIRYVLPRDVYLDDLNVCDMTTAQVATLNVSAPWAASPTGYPTRGTSYDALGKVYVQEYLGEYYFWWDMDNDGVAEIYPSGTGSATATKDCDGNTITAYHEANFAYQLADFCYGQTENEIAVHGFIGVKPPTSWSTKDVSNWVGKLPVYTTDSNNNSIVSTNGTGLMGNKWMAGRKSTSGLPAHTIGSIAGLAYGGFIATDTGWPDGVQEYDTNDHLVDLGKYISVIPAYMIFSNPTSTQSYLGNLASWYSGFVTTLPFNSAPTNKSVKGLRSPFTIRNDKLDTLAGLRYVMVKNSNKNGPVIADAPTAARPDSDYQRFMTITIVNGVIEGIRDVAAPFLGEAALSGPKLAGLNTAIDQKVSSYVPSALEKYKIKLDVTPSLKIQGKAILKLVLTPVSELRNIEIELSLSIA